MEDNFESKKNARASAYTALVCRPSADHFLFCTLVFATPSGTSCRGRTGGEPGQQRYGHGH
jgi:hypothetical protein